MTSTLVEVLACQHDERHRTPRPGQAGVKAGQDEAIVKPGENRHRRHEQREKEYQVAIFDRRKAAEQIAAAAVLEQLERGAGG